MAHCLKELGGLSNEGRLHSECRNEAHGLKIVFLTALVKLMRIPMQL